MNEGKGTADFEAYIRNLQQGLATAAAGLQLRATSPGLRVQRSLVENPYAATVAQAGILRFRAAHF
ncbi:MAG: hypothetical protein AB7L90_21680 [Hyphomicrobiaceae bacterium]